MYLQDSLHAPYNSEPPELKESTRVGQDVARGDAAGSDASVVSKKFQCSLWFAIERENERQNVPITTISSSGTN